MSSILSQAPVLHTCIQLLHWMSTVQVYAPVYVSAFTEDSEGFQWGGLWAGPRGSLDGFSKVNVHINSDMGPFAGHGVLTAVALQSGKVCACAHFAGTATVGLAHAPSARDLSPAVCSAVI